MATLFKDEIIVHRSSYDLLTELSASTINPGDRKNYGRKGEFRGEVWYKGFRLALNTPFWNSFEAQATGRVRGLTTEKCFVRINISVSTFAIVFLCVWNVLFIAGLIAASISVFSSGSTEDWTVMLLFVPFLVVDVVFLRFALYSNYKKLKRRMLELLE